MAVELDDDPESLQAKETAHRLPVGIVLLFAGLVAWGIYYLYAYSPWSTGWTQEADLTSAASVGTNIGHTVAFTAIPAAVIVVLAVAMARRRRGG